MDTKINAPRGGSSHCTFRKDNEKAITIPKHKPVKVFYVALVKEIVEMEEKKHENN